MNLTRAGLCSVRLCKNSGVLGSFEACIRLYRSRNFQLKANFQRLARFTRSSRYYFRIFWLSQNFYIYYSFPPQWGEVLLHGNSGPQVGAPKRFRVTQLNCLLFNSQSSKVYVTRWLGFRANRERCMLGLQFREVRGKRVRAVREAG